VQETSTERTAAENHDLSSDGPAVEDAVDMTVDVTPANQAVAKMGAEGDTVAGEAGVAEAIDEEMDGAEDDAAEGWKEAADEEWEVDGAVEEEPIVEVLVDTAIAVGAAAVSMFGSVAGAAMRFAGTTHAGQVVGDITAGVRKAVAREGEPYLETAGRWSQEQLARVVAAVTPAVVDAIDFTEMAERLDLDALLARIDTDALMERVDVERMAERVNVRALLEQLDLTSVRLRVDLAPECKPDASGT